MCAAAGQGRAVRGRAAEAGGRGRCSLHAAGPDRGRLLPAPFQGFAPALGAGSLPCGAGMRSAGFTEGCVSCAEG